MNIFLKMNIKQITDEVTKKAITKNILFNLPEWFGLPESTNEYIEQSVNCTYFVSYKDKEAVGFIALKPTTKDTLDIYCMGILKDYQGNKIGKKLIDVAITYALENNYKLIQVKTVNYGSNKHYDMTNMFYKAMGFYELEVFPTLWDTWNPCLIYVMPI